MIGIYKIINPIGEIYIGASKHLERRFKDYKKNNYKAQRKIFESISKYGVENHIFTVIEECDIPDLNKRERYWQEHYDSVENGLNCQYVNTDTKKRKLSSDTCFRMSQGLKGKIPYNKGLKLTKESIDKRTDKQANVYLNTETFIFYSFKELILLHNKKPTTLRRHIDKSKNIIRVWYQPKQKAEAEKELNCKIV